MSNLNRRARPMRSSEATRGSDPIRLGRPRRGAHAPYSRRCTRRIARRTFHRAVPRVRPVAKKSPQPGVAPTVESRCPPCPHSSRVSRSCSHPTVVSKSIVAVRQHRNFRRALRAPLGKLLCVHDGGAFASMLAVPSVPVEKDEMRSKSIGGFLVDPEKLLDRCTSPAFLLRVERGNSEYGRRSRALEGNLDLGALAGFPLGWPFSTDLPCTGWCIRLLHLLSRPSCPNSPSF